MSRLPTRRPGRAVRTAAPLQTRDVATIGVGVGLWLVAVVVLYAVQATGAAAVPDGWLWTAVAGAFCGTVGVFSLWRRDMRSRR